MSRVEIERPDRQETSGGRLAWHRVIPSLPLIVALAAFARALAQPLGLLNDPDTYLHVAAGRWMIAHGALPTHDPLMLSRSLYVGTTITVRMTLLPEATIGVR